MAGSHLQLEMCQPLRFTARHVEFAKPADIQYITKERMEIQSSQGPCEMEVPASNKPVSSAKRARTSCLTFLSGDENRLPPTPKSI
jgi:hypothetical protein